MCHGDCDTIVPVTESVAMLNSVNKRGGNAKLQICYGVGHNAWDYAYAGDELLNWLLEQKSRRGAEHENNCRSSRKENTASD